MTDVLDFLRAELRKFASEREWDQFHSPKNLAIAMSVEAAEVLEHFQWLTAQESASLGPHVREEVRLELADVLLYLIRLADQLDMDLATAARDKLLLNAEKYPIDRAKGTAKKYSEL
jgi:dCTP diphosphatase